MNITNHVSQPLSHQFNDELNKDVITEIEKQILPFDALLLVIKIGTIASLNNEIDKTHVFGATNSKDINGFKLSLNKKNSTVDIQEPNRTRGLMRRWQGDSREQLLYIRPHLIKALKWFPPEENENYRVLFEKCKQGLEILLKTYSPKKKSTVVLTSTEKTALVSDSFTKLNLYQGETITHPGLAYDIDLLNQALSASDKQLGSDLKSRVQEFKSQLSKEEEIYFPCQTLMTFNASKQTIETYLQERVKSCWEDKTIQIIADLFLLEPNATINPSQAINALIKNNSVIYTQTKENLINSLDLSRYSISKTTH